MDISSLSDEEDHCNGDNKKQACHPTTRARYILLLLYFCVFIVLVPHAIVPRERPSLRGVRGYPVGLWIMITRNPLVLLLYAY